MLNGFLLSHVWTQEGQDYKHDLIDRVLSHYRHNYPDHPIILSGHGKKPPKEVTAKADHTIWYNQIIQGEVGRGHPKCVSEGLLLAKRLGWSHVFKNRADMVIGCDNIFAQISLSLGRTDYRGIGFFEGDNLHDITIYADTDVLIDAWDQTKWDNSLRVNGVINSNNALKAHGYNVKDTFATADNEWFPMVYLDPWWNNTFKVMPDDEFLNNQYDVSRFSFFNGYSKRAQSL
jgi:hypothetical protein